jgi:hypothetical protein
MKVVLHIAAGAAPVSCGRLNTGTYLKFECRSAVGEFAMKEE